MSEREGNDWFCPRCAEYGAYVGVIHPTSSEHPAFYDECRASVHAAKELLPGWEVEFTQYGTKAVQYLGQIIDICPNEKYGTKIVVIEKEPAEPFMSQRITIKYDQFLDWWQKPDPTHRSNALVTKDANEIYLV